MFVWEDAFLLLVAGFLAWRRAGGVFGRAFYLFNCMVDDLGLGVYYGEMASARMKHLGSCTECLLPCYFSPATFVLTRPLSSVVGWSCFGLVWE